MADFRDVMLARAAADDAARKAISDPRVKDDEAELFSAESIRLELRALGLTLDYLHHEESRAAVR